MKIRKRVEMLDVAVVGTGVIGRSWIRVFSGAGCQVHIYDKDPRQLHKALDWFASDLKLDQKEGFLSAKEAMAQRACLTVHRDLQGALKRADYIQESGPERLDFKRKIYAELDRASNPRAVLASSTSSFDMTEIAKGLLGAHRCIVAHPVNPPHVIPVVEVLAGKQTRADVVKRAVKFLRSVGQKPVLLNCYVKDFLLNRMQAALLREAIQLVEHGVTDVEGVDTVIRDGLGLRWVLMGPFGVADTNADGGVREYLTRFRKPYIEGMNDLFPSPSLGDAMIERLGRGMDAMSGTTPREKIRRWRDRMIRQICSLKRRDPQP